MFKVSPASLHTFIDTPNCVHEDRVQYSTVRIQNVFCDSHIFKIFLYCNHQVHTDFLITLYIDLEEGTIVIVHSMYKTLLLVSRNFCVILCTFYFSTVVQLACWSATLIFHAV
jgi:hypothetical protein